MAKRKAVEFDFKMLGPLVKAKRLRDKMSQRSLAQHLGGIGTFTVWRIEHCKGRTKCQPLGAAVRMAGYHTFSFSRP